MDFACLALLLIALMVFRLVAYHLFPSLKIMLLTGLRHSMESANTTPAEIEQNIGRANSNFTLGMIAGTLFSYAVPGIISVLGTSAIFAKRKA